MAPPSIYSRWWQMTVACSGRSRDMAAMRWYRTPEASFSYNGQEYGGVWQGDRIVIADSEVYDGPLVRHEILHALLGTAAHPRKAFLSDCSSIVECLSACVADAGRWVAPSNYELLSVDSLYVSVKLEYPVADADSAPWLMEWVSVQNTRNQPILAIAPGEPRRPDTFSYQMRGPFGGIQGGVVAFDSSTLFFEPLETKRWLFEFRLSEALSQYTYPITIPPGPYSIRGAYGRQWSEIDTLTLTP